MSEDNAKKEVDSNVSPDLSPSEENKDVVSMTVEKKGGARPKTPKSAAAQKSRTESQLKDTVKGANKKRAFGKNISDVQSRSITPEDDQLVTFTMKHGPRREMVQCHTSDSLIEAIINHQKQIKGGDQDFNFIFVEIIEGKELKPTIPNLGIPAKLISDKTIVCEVKSPGGSKQQLNPSSLIRKYGRGKNLYTLYISSETVGPTNKSFLVYPNHYSNCRIRIDFTENESLLDALTMDGRFTANLSNFVLVDESYGTEIYLFHKAFSYKDKTLSLKHLGKHVAVTNSSVTGSVVDGDDASNSPKTPRATGLRKPNLVALGDVNRIAKLVGRKYKLNLRNRTRSETEAQKINEIYWQTYSLYNEPCRVSVINEYQYSVGIIYWSDKDGKLYNATCFRLGEKACCILTNRHVLFNIENSVREQGMHLENVNVRFNFVKGKLDPNDPNNFKLKGENNMPAILFESPNDKLDYVILKLDSPQGSSFSSTGLFSLPPPLGHLLPSSMPDMTLLYIMGYSETRQLTMESCVTLDLMDARNVPTYIRAPHGQLPDTDSVFQQTSLLHGASGSPIFTCEGQLVGVHTRGYFRVNSSRSEFEQGVTLKAIIRDVQLQIDAMTEGKTEYEALFQDLFPNEHATIADSVSPTSP